MTTKRALVLGIFVAMFVCVFTGVSVAGAASNRESGLSTSRCSSSVSLPFEWNGEITASGNASCGYNYLSYFQVCIMKEQRFFSDKTIACSVMDPLGGYMADTFGPSTLEAVGYCNGAGNYYSELRWSTLWSTLSLRDIAKLLDKKPSASMVAGLGYDYYVKGSMGKSQKRTPSVYMCD